MAYNQRQTGTASTHPCLWPDLHATLTLFLLLHGVSESWMLTHYSSPPLSPLHQRIAPQTAKSRDEMKGKEERIHMGEWGGGWRWDVKPLAALTRRRRSQGQTDKELQVRDFRNSITPVVSCQTAKICSGQYVTVLHCTC